MTDTTTSGDTAVSDDVDERVLVDGARERAGLAQWQWDQAALFGLVPAADDDGRLTGDQVDDVVARAAAIRTAVGEDRPIGAWRSADRLTARQDIEADVEPADVETLAAAGDLVVVGEYNDRPLYSTGQLDALDAARVVKVVDERHEWVSNGFTFRQAAERLGWKWQEVADVVKARELPVRFGNLSGADVDALADDVELNEQIELDRPLTADQAAERLEIRRADFNHLVRLDLVQPALIHEKLVGRTRSVSVPLYRTGDLDDVAEHAPVDLEEVRATKPGKPSPLARIGAPKPSRANAVHKGMRDLAGEFGADCFAVYNMYRDLWEIDYDRHVPGAPDEDTFMAAAKKHPAMRHHARDIAVGSEVTRAVRWARRMREPGAAVVLDTETTSLDGYVVEIAILDAATGDVLLDSRVNPGDGVEMDPGAYAVHGIHLDHLTDQPALADLWPAILDATRGRVVIAYNAAFDQAIVRGHAERDGLDHAHLGQPGRWQCLMDRYSDWLRTWRSLPLGGSHDAAGDCRAALDLLSGMTSLPTR